MGVTTLILVQIRHEPVVGVSPQQRRSVRYLLLGSTLHKHEVVQNYFCLGVNILGILPAENLRLFWFPANIREGFLLGGGILHLRCNKILSSTIVEQRSGRMWTLP